MKRLLVAYLIIIGILWFPTPVSADKTYSEPIATPQPVENIPRIDTIEPISTADDIKQLEYIVIEPKAFVGAVFSSGNGYTPGQCTWYVKNMRPDIPNNWGNAYEWLWNAQSQGWPTGTEPRVNAIGWTSNHVVIITGVHDGMVDITDMNGNYVPYEIGSGTYPASKYQYIY